MKLSARNQIKGKVVGVQKGQTAGGVASGSPRPSDCAANRRWGEGQRSRDDRELDRHGGIRRTFSVYDISLVDCV